jgi:DNA invertase Pin-like site-specific DNA recombinase
MSSWQEGPVTRTWIVCRRLSPRRDGERRREQADVDLVLVTAPDRLARNYVHQVLLIDELAGHGCQVEFPDRPVSADPHDQLLLQIRGAVAEYERTLIAERDAPQAAGQAAGGHAAAGDQAAVRVPPGPRAAP